MTSNTAHKLKDFHEILYYSYGKPEFPDRAVEDFYTEYTEINLFDFNSLSMSDTTVINKFTSGDVTDPEEAIKQVFYNAADTFSFKATCECGNPEITGNMFIGFICPICKTPVKTIDNQILKFRSMFRIPDYLPPIIHPQVYQKLSTWLGTIPNPQKKREKIKVLEAMLKTRKQFPVALKEAGFKFGLKYFYEHFDEIINFFTTKSAFVGNEILKKAPEMIQFLTKNRDKIFIRNLPVLNNTLHMLTSSQDNKCTYSDSQAGLIRSIYNILRKEEFNMITNRGSNTDGRMFSLMITYCVYSEEILKTKLFKKKGFILQNLISGRFHMTARCVITPIVSIHDLDELHIPWKVAIKLYRNEIFNLLVNRYYYTDIEAHGILMQSMKSYNSLIHEILNTLIDECPYKGLPGWWNRNPTMHHGSIQLVFVTGFKTDINDATISMSQGIVTKFNADFDGDEMNLFSIKEMGEVAAFLGMHPAATLIGENLEISGDVELVNRNSFHNFINFTEPEVIWH